MRFFRFLILFSFLIMVKLCERENETYAVTNLNIRDLMKIEGRRLLGMAGQSIDNLFTRLDKRRYLAIT